MTTRTEAFAETLEVALESADAVVTRVPVKRYLEAGAPLPQPRTEGALTIVPIFEEVLVVEKRILLKEEVHVELRKTVEQASIPRASRPMRPISCGSAALLSWPSRRAAPTS